MRKEEEPVTLFYNKTDLNHVFSNEAILLSNVFTVKNAKMN